MDARPPVPLRAAVRVLAAASFALTPLAAAQTTVACIWDRHADSPIGRFEAGTFPIDGQLYCFGGFFNQAIQATARVDAYDPVSDTWTQKADMPTATTHVGFALEGRNVWMIGGFEGNNPGFATEEVWVYDIDLDQWGPGPSMPRPIAAGGVAVIGRDLHYFGGCEADRDTMTGDHWVLDLDNQQLGWQPLAPMPQPRCHLSGAALNGEAWAVGGQFNHDTNPLDTRWVHVYDPMADTWRQGPLLPEARSHFEPATFVRNGNLYIAAGKDLTRGRDILASMLELDPVLGTWTYLAPLPNARYGAGAQPIGDRLYAANGAALFNDARPDLYSRDWSTQLPDPFLINCGGPEVVAASGTGCWCADVGALNGGVASFGTGQDVFDTDDDAVYHLQREGRNPREAVNYRFEVGPGFYRVTFYLAERAADLTGIRELDLLVEGVRYAKDIDMVDDHGFRTAAEYAYDVQVTDDSLDLLVRADPGQRAMVAAIGIERLGSDHFESECTSAPNSTGNPATVAFLGTTSIGRDELDLSMLSVPTNTFGLFIQARFAGTATLPGGTLCVQQPFFRLPPEQATGNVLTHRLTIQNPPSPVQQIVAGSTWRFQGWFRDGGSPVGYGLTDAVKLVFTP